jgi:Flp pilus assembly protein CpaB
MRRGRIFIYLALILIVGLVVAFLALRQLAPQMLAQTPPTPTLVEVVIAGQNISQGATITADELSTVAIPQDKVVSVMITSDQMSQLVGQVARFPLDQGVMITRPMVAENAAQIALSGPEWAATIPAGMSAIAIPTSRLASVAYGVTDGAHVNVTACMLLVDVDPSFQTILPNQIGTITAPANVPPPNMPGVSLGIVTNGGEGLPYQGRTELEPSFQQGLYVIPSEPQRPRMVCQMVFQDVIAMKVGNFPLQSDQQTTQEAGSTQTTQAPDLITLIVSPQDSVTLSYLVYSGAELTLTLRNAGDESRMATEAATLKFLLSQYNIPVPDKLPFAMEPRVDVLTQPSLPNDVVTAPSQ